MSSPIALTSNWLRDAMRGAPLAQLLLLAVGVLGWWVENQLLQRGLVMQVSMVVGDHVGFLVRHALENCRVHFS